LIEIAHHSSIGVSVDRAWPVAWEQNSNEFCGVDDQSVPTR